jgi:3',5'-cyclic-AMP phosphodiesterase
VPRPFLLVQLSDPHIGADWGERDSVATLSATVDAVRALEPRPDAVLITGDLADHAAGSEYEQLRELAARIDAPLHVLPGNHDDRAELRRHFDVGGTNGEPIQYATDLAALRLVVLDSQRPGEDGGELGADRLAWLDDALAGAPETSTIVAMHHPPLTTGIAAMDEIGLASADQRALGDVIERHPQVRRIAAGHLHLGISADLRGRNVLVAPSTYLQAVLDYGAETIELSAEPPGFAVHALVDGELASYVLTVS